MPDKMRTVITADYAEILNDSFAYTKNGLWNDRRKWLILILLSLLPAIPVISFIIFMVASITIMGQIPDLVPLVTGFAIAVVLAILLSAFYAGYPIRIYRGETPLPAIEAFTSLFSGGIRYIIVQCIYISPVILVLILTAGPVILSLASADSDPSKIFPVMLGLMSGLVIALILAFVIGLFAIIGIVRFARTGRMQEAFNGTEILRTIRSIGWRTYLIALIIMVIVLAAAQVAAGIIPIIGGIIQLIAAPWITVFASRYICLLYDSAVPA